MKPIILTFSGLNSYQEKQTIDFRALGDSGIFGIFGPTGSGKSTILDAITSHSMAKWSAPPIVPKEL